ncbi:MAG: NADP-dependent oxidoreductase [Parvibaculum sp.]|uniref:NADP-dependent oxidoreductase n=1 Tax=Parvibaculum sp. TaxID=2024848 RepID=UPI0028421842|nr:NADP-dependent oxidoreductase [Parvibaculum sp.]MDR3498814.1 NADP-dependent oxidoreductase [Parvibaculum sp.]
MKNDVNRQFRLKSRPVGRIKTSDFDLVEARIPEPGAGEALVRNLYLSLDPTNRIWMSDMDQYMPPVKIGEVMRGGGIGVVVKSNSSAYQVGDHVSGLVGWQDYTIAGEKPEQRMGVIPKGLPVPLTAMMGACGMTGLTAYFGLLELGMPKPGETVVVSAAAGAVGSVVGQIAKIKGCRAVGIAGGPDKCKWLTDELGFDAAVDYKRAGWKEELARATPNGIDVNFENVGGEIMEAVMARMNLFSRMPLCGMISGYNTGEPMRGDFGPILMKRIAIRGFIVIDFMAKYAEGSRQLAEWVAQGKIKHRETIVDGLEQAPTAVNKLFDGENMGKLIVKLADPEKF